MDGPPAIVFDEQGRVANIVNSVDRFATRGQIAVGASKPDVEATLGKPMTIRFARQLTEYQYSRPACGDCNYEDVRLWFDERNRLVAKQAVVMWD